MSGGVNPPMPLDRASTTGFVRTGNAVDKDDMVSVMS